MISPEIKLSLLPILAANLSADTHLSQKVHFAQRRTLHTQNVVCSGCVEVKVGQCKGLYEILAGKWNFSCAYFKHDCATAEIVNALRV